MIRIGRVVVQPVVVGSTAAGSLAVRPGGVVHVAGPAPARPGTRARRIDRRSARSAAARFAVAPPVDAAMAFSADASASCRGGKPDSTDVALEAISCAIQETALLGADTAWHVSFRTFDLLPSLAQVRLDARSRRVVDRALMAEMPWGSSLPGPAQRLINNELEQFDGPTLNVTVSDLEVWPPQTDGGLGELIECPADEVLVLLLGGVVPPELLGTRVRCVPVGPDTDPALIAATIVQACDLASQLWFTRSSSGKP
jgi:hypothetical protein